MGGGIAAPLPRATCRRPTVPILQQQITQLRSRGPVQPRSAADREIGRRYRRRAVTPAASAPMAGWQSDHARRQAASEPRTRTSVTRQSWRARLSSSPVPPARCARQTLAPFPALAAPGRETGPHRTAVFRPSRRPTHRGEVQGMFPRAATPDAHLPCSVPTPLVPRPSMELFRGYRGTYIRARSKISRSSDPTAEMAIGTS